MDGEGERGDGSDLDERRRTFAHLLQEAQGPIWAVLRRQLRTDEEAQKEVLSRVYQKTWSGYPKREQQAKELAAVGKEFKFNRWFQKIARNETLNYLRERGREAARRVRWGSGYEEQDPGRFAEVRR